MTHNYAQRHHGKDDGKGGYNGRYAHLHNLLEGEVQTQGEEQEHHANVGPGLDVGIVDYRHGVWHVRTYDEACHDVAKDKRLLELLE